MKISSIIECKNCGCVEILGENKEVIYCFKDENMIFIMKVINELISMEDTLSGTFSKICNFPEKVDKYLRDLEWKSQYTCNKCREENINE